MKFRAKNRPRGTVQTPHPAKLRENRIYFPLKSRTFAVGRNGIAFEFRPCKALRR
jgi:hypothetical protein